MLWQGWFSPLSQWLSDRFADISWQFEKFHAAVRRPKVEIGIDGIASITGPLLDEQR